MNKALTKPPPPVFLYLGGELVECENGRGVCRYQPKPEMANPFGLVQGGVVAAFLDSAIGAAIYSLEDQRRTSTVSFHLSYLKPVTLDAPVRAIGEVVHLGRTQAYVEARLERESDGLLLTRASATCVFLDGK